MRWIRTAILAVLLGWSLPGCALLTLPFALVGAILAIVQIPIQLALSLVGPATSLAATAAPYAMLFAKLEPEKSDWDLVLFQGKTGTSRQELFKSMESFARNYKTAAVYPASSKDLKEYVKNKNMRCYLASV